MLGACVIFLLFGELIAAFAAEPPHPLINQIIRTVCNYDMEKDTPQIKILKDGEELYKYAPQSGEHDELILEVTEFKENYFDLGLGGMYRCNVNKSTQEKSRTTEKPPGISVELIAEPSELEVHESVKLSCNYDLGGLPLYSVKYYKDSHEFFRYVPNEMPNKKIFPVRHVQVIEGGENFVEFRTTDLKSAGRYSCEVTTDGPFFTSKSASTDVRMVLVLGSVEPHVKLTVEPPNPKLGQTVTLSCDYSTGRDTLYSVSFYKDSKEFYKYIPSDQPTEIFFEVLQVKRTISTNKVLVEFAINDMEASGVYRCEVNIGPPSFLAFASEEDVVVKTN